MSEILRIDDLYGGYQEGVDILRGISMEVQPGESIGIIGLNGSGKSTFGKALMNMIPFRRGKVYFEGEDVSMLKTSELAHRGISIMQQGGKVFPTLSVWENLQLAGNSPFSTPHSPLMDIIPLLQRPKGELQHQMADKLSGGQKHQLSLAMTLANRPRLVILDEPSAGLSPKAVEEMYQMLRDVREKLGITIILIEQNIAKAVEFCHSCFVIGNGSIIKELENGDTKEIETILFNINKHF